MLNAIIYPSVKHWLPLMLDFLEHIHYIQRSNGEQWASPRLYTIHDRWFFKAWWGCGCIWYFIIWHHMEVSNSWRYSQYRPLWFGFFITYKPCSELGDSPFSDVMKRQPARWGRYKCLSQWVNCRAADPRCAWVRSMSAHPGRYTSLK